MSPSRSPGRGARISLDTAILGLNGGAIDPGKLLAFGTGVQASDVIRTATELFERGHHSGVAALCSDALAHDPDDLAVRILLARALVALRQDDRASRELGEILRRDGNSSMAFQLLGEIAYRHDDYSSAEIYFRESWRLDPQNASARIWLDVTLTSQRTDHGLPFSGDAKSDMAVPSPASRRRFAQGTDANLAAAPARRARSSRSARPARPRVLSAGPTEGTVRIRAKGTGNVGAALGPSNNADDRVLPDRFGGYMVHIGVLAPEDMPKVLAYHRTHGVRIGEAAVALGFIQPQKLGWAALAFHCRQQA